MVRKEIKEFELIVGERSLSATAPVCVSDLLKEQGVDCCGEEIILRGRITLDSTALSMKYIYLRIGGVYAPATLYVGDKMLLELDGVTPVYHLDLSGCLVEGENLISLRFSGDCKLSLVGIAMPMELVRFSSAVISGVSLCQMHSEDTVSLGVKLDIIGNPDSVRAVATLTSPTGQLYYSGLTGGEGSLTVKNPLYWWPLGMGVQNLYRLSVNLYGESEIEDSIDLRLGLRSVSLTDRGIMINGSRFLPMGAVYYANPGECFRASSDRLNQCISSAERAGYNCLVLPLDSSKPGDGLYRLADEKGIVIIEEGLGLNDAERKALSVRAYHPSLCILDLIGEGALSDGATSDIQVVKASAAPIYASQPTLPSMRTLAEEFPISERTLFSRSIEGICDNGAINKMLSAVAERYPYPRDLEGFAYASALAAANKIADSIKAARLSENKNARAIFDGLCDNRLAASSSAMDCKMRSKPLYYYVQNSFKPVRLYADIKESKICFSASNLRRLDCIGEIEYRIADSDNRTLHHGSIPCEIPAFSSAILTEISMPEDAIAMDNRCYVEYSLREGNTHHRGGTLLLVPEKHFDFVRPNIKFFISGKDGRFSITLSADRFVRDLEIGFAGIDVTFEDNYIDITTPAPVKIGFSAPINISVEKLESCLSLTSIFDLKQGF